MSPDEWVRGCTNWALYYLARRGGKMQEAALAELVRRNQELAKRQGGTKW